MVAVVAALAVAGGAGGGVARGDVVDGSAGDPDAWRRGLVLSSPVMDWAGVLGKERKAALVEAIRAGTATNGAQLVVVSLPSLRGGEIGDFAYKLFNQWGIGEKDRNNGVLLLLALADREVGIVVGEGFEEALPDSLCGRIRDEVILPRFRAGDPASALEAGASALLEVMAGESFGERDGKGARAGGWFFWAVFAGVVVLIVWSATKRRRSVGDGGGGGEAPRRRRWSGLPRHGRMGAGNHGGPGRRGGGFHGRGGRSGGGGAHGGC